MHVEMSRRGTERLVHPPRHLSTDRPPPPRVLCETTRPFVGEMRLLAVGEVHYLTPEECLQLARVLARWARTGQLQITTAEAYRRQEYLPS